MRQCTIEAIQTELRDVLTLSREPTLKKFSRSGKNAGTGVYIGVGTAWKEKQPGCVKLHILMASVREFLDSTTYLGSSTETVAFQVYEILKIDHEFLQFF